jgi:hypothetical protein
MNGSNMHVVTKNCRYPGIAIEAIDYILRKLKMPYEAVQIFEEENCGALVPNKNASDPRVWTGYLGALQAGNVDLLVGDYTPMNDESSPFSFPNVPIPTLSQTHPIFPISTHNLEKKEGMYDFVYSPPYQLRHVVAAIGRTLDTATDSERAIQMTTLLVRMFEAPAWGTILFCAIALYFLDRLIPSTKHVTLSQG